MLLVGEEQVPEPLGLRSLAKLHESSRVRHAGADLLVELVEDRQLVRVVVLFEEGVDAALELLDAL